MTCARVSVMALLAALPFSRLSAEITLDGTMGPAGPDTYLPSPGLALETSTVSAAHSTNVPVPLHNDMNGDAALQLAMSGLGCS